MFTSPISKRAVQITEDVARRFISKLEMRGSDECWEWQAGTVTGYGQLCISGKNFLAHRLAWLFWRGPIPDGLCVLHTCDNRPCCNPRHLWLGSRAENNADMVAKGRQGAKLTVDQAREIFERYHAGGATLHALAEEYGIDRSNVGYIANGQRWKHATADLR